VLVDRREGGRGQGTGAEASGRVVCLAISSARRPLYHPDKARSLGGEGVKVRDGWREWIDG
jgi:hypothetical protein